jgi:hypothetical protein
MKHSANHTLEQILEYSIVASWKDLTHGVQPGLIHIEYNFAAGGTLDDLRIWSSITRGHWRPLPTPTAAACASKMDTTQRVWHTRLSL